MENSSEKDKIRRRYKGISQEALEKIPAIEKKDIFVDNSEKRVGVYARVSTGDPRQTSSFELQQNHYTDLIDRRPGWHLYRLYADEGLSGTSLKHRDAFLQMIEDCKQHKLDLIITKSVSRFARNIYDCIGYVRELAALKPPTLSASVSCISFSSCAVRKLNTCRQVELLLDPRRKLLAVRPAARDNKNANAWVSFDGKKNYPRKIAGSAYLPVIFDLMDWKKELRYTVRGECMGNGREYFLVFDLKDAAMVVRQAQMADFDAAGGNLLASSDLRAATVAIPPGWLTNFGSEYYAHSETLPAAGEDQEAWNVHSAGKPSPRRDSLNVTGEEELKRGIDSIIAAIREGKPRNG